MIRQMKTIFHQIHVVEEVEIVAEEVLGQAGECHLEQEQEL